MTSRVPVQPLRSLMFVPGHRPRMIDRALGLGEFAPSQLDVAILDLEDGVPPSEKQNARAAIAAALGRDNREGRPSRYVRVNAAADLRAADLAAIVRAGLGGIVAPKIARANEVTALAHDLEQCEIAAGLAHGSLRIIASIESARGLLEAPAIAASSERVVALLFGAEDFALDLGLPARREAEAADLLHARSAVVVAAAAAGKAAIDGIWPDIADEGGLTRDALTARRLGFLGKSLIHPGQIDRVNRIFSPSADEVEHARRVIAAFDEGTKHGDGAVALDGTLLDPPIVGRARRTLSVHDAIVRR
ncbi:MAG TPA: CoA ester lyase [Candidatus Limnocylindria bacterium]|jgi:citrate lyase subunit beta/citryl-CoA lyase|nr:CoA ester lyase [Candidatus Limnocylindria bacterium]